MKNLIVLLAAIFFVSSCKKETTELPVASATGANTFGASVNGILWSPKGFGIVPTTPILESYYQPNRSIIIKARNFASSPKESEFEIYLNNVVRPGVYILNGDSGNYAYYVERKITPTGEWKTGGQYMGSVTITVADTVNRILAGTFQFQAAHLYGGEPVNVTEGRFDLKVQ